MDVKRDRLICYVLLFHTTILDVTTTPTTQKCPGISGTLYRAGEGLEEFPDDEAYLDECEGLDISHNDIHSLRNGHCVNCDFLDASKNRLTELDEGLVQRFPNLTHVRVNENEFQTITPEVVRKVRQLDVEYNRVPLKIPWDVVNNLKISLEGTRILCDCSMKRAVEEHRVDILSPPICEGYTNIQCSLTTRYPGTGIERTPEVHTITDSHNTWFIVFWVSFPVWLIVLATVWNRKKIKAKLCPGIQGISVDHGGQAVVEYKDTPPTSNS